MPEQLQVKSLEADLDTVSLQIPLFKQGFGMQLSISRSQKVPSNPVFSQLQIIEFRPFCTQIPGPQGLGWQGSGVGGLGGLGGLGGVSGDSGLGKITVN